MNLGELRTQLQTLGYGTDTATQQSAQLNAVYRTVAGLRRWPWLEAASTALTLTAGTSTVSLAAVTDHLHTDAVRLEYDTSYVIPQYREPQEFRNLEHMDRDVGVPMYWTDRNGVLNFWPSPDRDYTVRLDYLRAPTEMSLDADEPAFDATYHDVLVWGAAVPAAYRQRDWNAAQFAQQQFDRYIAMLYAAYGVRQRQTLREVEHNPDRYVPREFR